MLQAALTGNPGQSPATTLEQAFADRNRSFFAFMKMAIDHAIVRAAVSALQNRRRTFVLFHAK
jgi:hypothetical protein